MILDYLFGIGSLPTRGAWIEMALWRRKSADVRRSLPTRGAWIEITAGDAHAMACRSLPTRGAWIEIGMPSTWM